MTPLDRGSRRIAVFLSVLVVGLAVFLSAPCQGAGEPTFALGGHGGPPLLIGASSFQPGLEQAIRDVLFPVPDLSSKGLRAPLFAGEIPETTYTGKTSGVSAKLAASRWEKSPATAATHPKLQHEEDAEEYEQDATESDNSDNEPSVLLTPKEYKLFRQIIGIEGAAPLIVGLVKGANVGVAVLIAMCAFILGLVIMRRIFNYWWDKDIFDNTWASVCVVCVKLLVLGWIITSAVRG